MHQRGTCHQNTMRFLIQQSKLKALSPTTAGIVAPELRGRDGCSIRRKIVCSCAERIYFYKCIHTRKLIFVGGGNAREKVRVAKTGAAESVDGEEKSAERLWISTAQT
jgi:hypothetical protein